MSLLDRLLTRRDPQPEIRHVKLKRTIRTFDDLCDWSDDVLANGPFMTNERWYPVAPEVAFAILTRRLADEIKRQPS